MPKFSWKTTENLSKRVRKHVINMTHLGNSSHIGSVLSIVDILSVLYGKIMKVDPKNPSWDERDRLILSKGHAGAGIYATLAECGFMPVDKLKTHYQDGSDLSGHVSHKGIPGVEFSTGSLGHGLGVSAGMALAAKRRNKSNRVFCILSDGECDEGSNWEAILFDSHHKLGNLTAIVDYNKLQSLDTTQNTLALEPFADKWRAFGWHVIETDGHDHPQLEKSLSRQSIQENKPTCIIAHTTKGKGVSFMENNVLWHYRSPQGEEFENALKEIDNA